MGVVNLKSTVITNRDAQPVVLSNPHMDDGLMRESVGVLAIGAADTLASTYRFATVPSNARITSLKYSQDAECGVNQVLEFGVYQTTQNGGAAVQAACFAASINNNSTILNNADVLLGGTYQTIANGEKRLWEVLGLTADPFVEYDIVATSTQTNTTTGANAKLSVGFVI